MRFVVSSLNNMKSKVDKERLVTTEAFSESVNQDASYSSNSKTLQSNPKTKSRPRWPFAVLALFFVLYIGMLIDSIEEEETQVAESNLQHPIPLGNSDTSDPSDIRLQLWVSHPDTTKKNLEARVYFFPSPRIFNRTLGGINFDLMADFGLFEELYRQDTNLPSISLAIPVNEGSPFLYPFEVFRAEFDLKITKFETGEPLKISVDIMASSPALWFDVKKLETPSESAKKNPKNKNIAAGAGLNVYEIVISRPKNVIVFSMFVVIILWVITVAMVGMATTLYMSGDRPSPPYLGLGPALMFAMPNLRASQPGVPSIGTMLDLVGFIW